jgi:hypothetical protein
MQKFLFVLSLLSIAMAVFLAVIGDYSETALWLIIATLVDIIREDFRKGVL